MDGHLHLTSYHCTRILLVVSEVFGSSMDLFMICILTRMHIINRYASVCPACILIRVHAGQEALFFAMPGLYKTVQTMLTLSDHEATNEFLPVGLVVFGTLWAESRFIFRGFNIC